MGLLRSALVKQLKACASLAAQRWILTLPWPAQINSCWVAKGLGGWEAVCEHFGAEEGVLGPEGVKGSRVLLFCMLTFPLYSSVCSQPRQPYSGFPDVLVVRASSHGTLSMPLTCWCSDLYCTWSPWPHCNNWNFTWVKENISPYPQETSSCLQSYTGRSTGHACPISAAACAE